MFVARECERFCLSARRPLYPDGDRKLSGKVAYAVIGYGGFLGMGEEHYPTPWSNLKYDTNLGGYLVNFTRDQIEQAPKYANDDDWQWSRENDRRVYDYYRTTPYWGAA